MLLPCLQRIARELGKAFWRKASVGAAIFAAAKK